MRAALPPHLGEDQKQTLRGRKSCFSPEIWVKITIKKRSPRAADLF